MSVRALVVLSGGWCARGASASGGSGRSGLEFRPPKSLTTEVRPGGLFQGPGGVPLVLLGEAKTTSPILLLHGLNVLPDRYIVGLRVALVQVRGPVVSRLCCTIIARREGTHVETAVAVGPHLLASCTIFVIVVAVDLGLALDALLLLLGHGLLLVSSAAASGASATILFFLHATGDCLVIVSGLGLPVLLLQRGGLGEFGGLVRWGSALANGRGVAGDGGGDVGANIFGRSGRDDTIAGSSGIARGDRVDGGGSVASVDSVASGIGVLAIHHVLLPAVFVRSRGLFDIGFGGASVLGGVVGLVESLVDEGVDGVLLLAQVTADLLLEHLADALGGDCGEVALSEDVVDDVAVLGQLPRRQLGRGGHGD